jgi:hypothetical protein
VSARREVTIRWYEVPDGVSTLRICVTCRAELGRGDDECENCARARAYDERIRAQIAKAGEN